MAGLETNMEQKAQRKKGGKRAVVWRILLILLGILALAALIFTRFGGFGTGDSPDPAEFAAYAGTVEDIAIPDYVRVIALGEATHGNAQFQQLKLDVFRIMVERYGVRAFALEGDYGGCEQVNRYIHGGDGTAREAAAAIGFAIYRTEEMAELIAYMREYNDTAAQGEDLRFYGFDMQRCAYSFDFLVEACKAAGADTAELERLVDDAGWSGAYDSAARTDTISRVKAELESKGATAQAVHFADMLLQNLSLQGGTDADYALLRDAFMAQSVQWILEQEAALGHERILISGHNGHIAKWGSYDAMGKLLSDELGESYYAIGTDFYKTRCNMPRPNGKRTNQVFYSHDPLAKAAQRAGLDICWLDFAKVPETAALAGTISDYTYMGSLGEGYGWYMRLLPPSYRIFQPPATLYDGMIFVSDASPTTILSED